MKNQWKLVVALFLFLLVAILAVLNVEPVPVNLGFQVIELPLILLILGTLLVGVLITAIFSTVKLYQERREVQKLDHELAEIDEKYQKQLNEKLLKKENEIEKLNVQISSYEREIHNIKQSIPAYMSKKQNQEAKSEMENDITENTND